MFTGHQHTFERLLLRCCWSPDGKRVAAGSADRIVYIWDVQSLQLAYALPGHKGSVNEVAFHPKVRPYYALGFRVQQSNPNSEPSTLRLFQGERRRQRSRLLVVEVVGYGRGCKDNLALSGVLAQGCWLDTQGQMVDWRVFNCCGALRQPDAQLAACFCTCRLLQCRDAVL